MKKTPNKKFKAVRKSAFISFKHCNKQFEYFYNDPKYWEYGNKEDEPDEKKRRGNEFHAATETFFDKVKEKTNNISPGVMRECLPITQDSTLSKYFDWFVDMEFKRWQNLLYKNPKEFFPIANELKVYMKDLVIDRTGHIDRIDVIPGTKNLRIVEYKAGASYDMEKPDRVTSMNAEIGWYVQILKDIKEYPEYKITEWMVMNQALEKIWINKISPISLKAVENTYSKMIDMIIKGLKFPKNVGPLCDYCPYLEECDPYYEEKSVVDFGKAI